METHAERVYPEECCGLLVGKLDVPSEDALGEYASSKDNGYADRQKRLVELIELENKWTADIETDIADLSQESTYTKQRRYWIDPKDLLNAQKFAREKGLSIIGVYHSHPDHVAVPSECDRQLAWPEYAYIIVSVQKGKAVDLKNWALNANHQFEPEAIRLSPSAAKDRMPVSA